MVQNSVSRRQLLERSATAAAAILGCSIVSSRARAQQKTLKILQWKHFVPSYDEWFNGTYVKDWEEANNTEVIVDNVGVADIEKLAQVEMEARRGHDLVLFIKPLRNGKIM